MKQGIKDFGHAKRKAANRLGLSNLGALPTNIEIQNAVSEYLNIFNHKDQNKIQCILIKSALSIMESLNDYNPRLVGPLLDGKGLINHPINLHVFTDTPELISKNLDNLNIRYKLIESRLKERPGRSTLYPGYRFLKNEIIIETIVFPYDGIRQAPICSITDKPMKRADKLTIEKLIK